MAIRTKHTCALTAAWVCTSSLLMSMSISPRMKVTRSFSGKSSDVTQARKPASVVASAGMRKASNSGLDSAQPAARGEEGTVECVVAMFDGPCPETAGTSMESLSASLQQSQRAARVVASSRLAFLVLLQVEQRPHCVRRLALALEVRSRQHLADQPHRDELHADHDEHRTNQQERVARHERATVMLHPNSRQKAQYPQADRQQPRHA